MDYQAFRRCKAKQNKHLQQRAGEYILPTPCHQVLARVNSHGSHKTTRARAGIWGCPQTPKPNAADSFQQDLHIENLGLLHTGAKNDVQEVRELVASSLEELELNSLNFCL